MAAIRKPQYVTTRDRQIDFIGFLFSQDFTINEIAKIYNVPRVKIEGALKSKAKNHYELRKQLATTTKKRMVSRQA